MLTKIPSKILKNTRGNFILSNIALKCVVIALKKNSLHASPNHPRGRQTFLFALCSYRKSFWPNSIRRQRPTSARTTRKPQASMWKCREPRRFRSQSESMRAFLTDCRYRSTIEVKEADNGRPDATGENQSFFMKTPKKGSCASTQIPPPMIPSPKYDPTIKPSLITSIPAISPKSKRIFQLSTLNKIH